MDQVAQIDRIADVGKVTHAAAGRILKAVVQMIGMEVLNSGRIAIAGLGIFTIRNRKAREARIPLGVAKGQTKMVPAHKSVGFKPSKELKRAVNPDPLLIVFSPEEIAVVRITGRM